MPVVTASVQPEPAAVSESAATVCAQCGATLTPGKRFCKNCGHAAGGPPTNVEASPLPKPTPVIESKPAAVPGTSVCAQCGAVLAPGKRFCKLCGHAVDAPVALPEIAPGDPAPMAAGPALAANPEIASRAEFTPEAIPASKSEPAEETATLPLSSSAAIPPRAPLAAPTGRSKATLWLAIGLAAAVLAMAGGGWAWYVHMHRNAFRGTEPAAQTQPSATQSPAQQQAAATPGTAVQPAKPKAGASIDAVPPPPRISPKSAVASTRNTVPISQLQHPGSFRQVNPAAPTPVFYPPKTSSIASLPAQSKQAHSGMLHYQGPPVAYNGTVAFDNLPKERLKFSFDHTAWQLILKRNPDRKSVV